VGGIETLFWEITCSDDCNKLLLGASFYQICLIVNSGPQPKHRFLWIVLIFLALIGVVMILRRTLFLIPVLQNNYQPTAPVKGMPYFPEEGFVQNPLLTLIHILPALLFVLLGPLQFVKSFRARSPQGHRWIGRIVLCSGVIVGFSGIIMGFKMAISGVSETAAITFFGILFLFSLLKAYLHIRHQHIVLHRQWMIRAFVLGMAVTTTRLIVGVFFATSPLTGLTARDFFGTALWLGFTIHLIAAEVWINHTKD
jgi:uncharacterized membrane protein